VSTSKCVSSNGTMVVDSVVSYKLQPSIGALRQHTQLFRQLKATKELQSFLCAYLFEYRLINSCLTSFGVLAWFPTV